MGLDIKYADAPLGHEIRGLDVRSLDAATFDELERTWDRYGVIIISGQTLSPDDQVAFSKRFGPLDHYNIPRYNMKTHPEIFIVSNVIENGEPIGLGDAGRYWHSDMWTVPRPPRGSMLYALEVPLDASGKALGDTMFASTAAAYDALPPALLAKIEGKRGVYSKQAYVDFRAKAAAHGNGADAAEPPVGKLDKDGMAERAALGVEEIAHPLIRNHPRTGRKCIYFSEGAVVRIEGMSAAESAPILEDLRRHVLQSQFIYRHSWRVGDVVMWDNCSSIHKAIGDFEWPQRRRMHRTTLANPIAA